MSRRKQSSCIPNSSSTVSADFWNLSNFFMSLSLPSNYSARSVQTAVSIRTGNWTVLNHSIIFLIQTVCSATATEERHLMTASWRHNDTADGCNRGRYWNAPSGLKYCFLRTKIHIIHDLYRHTHTHTQTHITISDICSVRQSKTSVSYLSVCYWFSLTTLILNSANCLCEGDVVNSSLYATLQYLCILFISDIRTAIHSEKIL